MVGVRLYPDDVAMVDLLVEGGVFRTRSEAICSIIHQGLQILPIAKMIPKLQEIKQLREEVKIELTDLGKQVKQGFDEAFGDDHVQEKSHLLIEKDNEGYIGFDSKKLELVINRGLTRVSLYKDTFTPQEKRLVERYFVLYVKGLEMWESLRENIRSESEKSIEDFEKQRKKSLKIMKRLEEIIQKG